MTRVGPIVDLWDFIFNLMTFKDTRDTLTFLCIASYAIIYQETVFLMLPLFPLSLIMFIFYNYFYEVKFKRPRQNLIRNMRLLQSIMQVMGDLIDLQLYMVENFIYWRSKQKTLFTMNLMLVLSFASIPLLFIPTRYLVVLSLWAMAGLSSPFLLAVCKSLFQITMEYAITAERFIPPMVENFVERVETVHIPRIQAILRWVPFVARYIPSADDYKLSIQRRAFDVD